MPYGTCKICGCTDHDPCYNPLHGNCYWVDDTHELCSHCADPDIANDVFTIHCINSTEPYYDSVAETLICAHCKHWHNEYEEVEDENSYGPCDINEWGCYGSDPMCADYDEREDNHED